MQRLLFEFEDQVWFPSLLRRYQTDFLGFVAEITALYQPAASALEADSGRRPRVVCDLASGSGMAAVCATGNLRESGWQLLLTDRFPNEHGKAAAAELENVAYLDAGLDILNDPLPKAAVYTMFNAFHHFSPAEQIRIAHAVRKNGGKLLVFEPIQPSLPVFLKVALATTLGLLLSAPFIKPFSIKRLALTYLLPVGVFVTAWDGLVSVLRALSRRDIERLAAQAATEGLCVSHSSLRSKLARLSCIAIE